MTTIQSARLDLIPMTPAFLQAALAGEQDRAAAVLGLTVPSEWFARTNQGVMQLRLAQLAAEPELQPWLLRAMAFRGAGVMIGAIGFHTRPGAAYLAELSPGGVEFGYQVFTPYRRQGYASEAATALMDWAHAQHAVNRFVLSISPQNIPSLGLAQKLGFTHIGAHVDEEDGPEDIFERRVS